MLTLASLLQQPIRLQIKDNRLTTTEINTIVQHGVVQLIRFCQASSINRQQLFVFLIRNNLEGIFCYFIASRLKLNAMIINIRDSQIVQQRLQDTAIAAWVVSHGTHGSLPAGKTCVLAFTAVQSALTIADDFTPWPTAWFYFMTSGTTGQPKFVKYQETRLLENAQQVSRYLQLGPADRTLCFFPVQYMYGLSTMLSTLISQGELIFDSWQINTASQLIQQYQITTLPLIGDWMLPLSQQLLADNYRVHRILNASDRLLTVQATRIMPCCEVLWNNFGQTESGPRLFCQRLESVGDIEKRSRHSVVAPGFRMTEAIQIRLTSPADQAEQTGRMFYQTPYAAEGYVDAQLHLQANDGWFDSGDLFSKDADDCYYWIARAANELKINGQFVPVQAISNQLLQEVGPIRHYFSKGEQGVIELTLESTTEKSHQQAISALLTSCWHRYQFDIKLVSGISVTHTGKIKMQVRA